MRRKRRNHSPEFKAKVALAAIQGDLTMAELVKKFDVHANQITDWKKQLLSNASDVFGKGAQKADESAQAIGQLHAKIGQLTMENDFSYGSFCQLRRNRTSRATMITLLYRSDSRSNEARASSIDDGSSSYSWIGYHSSLSRRGAASLLDRRSHRAH